MPRFTIGSLLTGAALFVGGVAAYEALVQRQRRVTMTAKATSPDGRVMAGSTDPLTGAVNLDGPNDLELADADAWSGGLDAATW